MQFSLALQGNLREFADKTERLLAEGATSAAERLSVIGKLAFRGDIRGAGLGDRLANTWQAIRYPKGQTSASPAVFLYSKAPMIVNAFTQGVTITHHDRLWLAIPTDNVPNVGGRGGHKASPQEVEVLFNQDLIFVRRGGNVLAFVDATAKKSGKGYRRATAKRLAQGRGTQLVLMFVLVPQVTLRKRLNWPQLAADLNITFADLLGSEIAARLQ